MEILSNYSLKNYNTFGIDVVCKTFVSLQSQHEASDYVKNKLDRTLPYILIGEGSNLLFTKDFEGTTIQMQNKGFELIDENNKFVWIRAAAGEKWDDFVSWSVEKKYAGAENLSKIPGNVGAAPIQNIGAYGVEIAEIFNGLEAIEIETGKHRRFYLKELKFGYRNSIFKQTLKNKYIITAVMLKLNKFPFLKIDYGNIKSELETMAYENLNIAIIRQAIINIRSSKLPEPKELGNAGSFFKNPVVDKQKHSNLKKSFPDLVAYDLNNGFFKLAAGWMIDHAGLKGYSKGNVAIHKNQALIIVNQGGASGQEILEFSEEIQSKILEMFGVKLEREVSVI
ncbi:MAG: UDP-N-acetylmuramate dehydrogenase [Bacteroidales bacterium]|jgi:UDP-N-acetylmuramate dehydrogenase|nr:UDP-N-acetylmuramate dehydrogenase [Bacteroidales bacterium]